jgi:hypothetical protein
MQQKTVLPICYLSDLSIEHHRFPLVPQLLQHTTSIGIRKASNARLPTKHTSRCRHMIVLSIAAWAKIYFLGKFCTTHARSQRNVKSASNPYFPQRGCCGDRNDSIVKHPERQGLVDSGGSLIAVFPRARKQSYSSSTAMTIHQHHCQYLQQQ